MADIPPLIPGLGREVEPRRELLLRPVVLGQVVDETVTPLALTAASPKAQIVTIAARAYKPDGSRVQVILYQNGSLTGLEAAFPPGVGVEFNNVTVKNIGNFKGRLFVRFRNAVNNALLQEITAVPETNPGSAIDFCIGVALPGCTESAITMPDGSLSIKIEAGHL